MKNVKTIGYAGLGGLQGLFGLLGAHGITDLIDVRSVPRSRYFCEFNDFNLKRESQKHGIEYHCFKTEFGARVENLIYFTNGVVDFEKFAKSAEFQSGISRVLEMLNGGKTVCLLCAEIDPINCHRAILCARNLAKSGIEIDHIIARRGGEISIENHAETEKRLLEMFGKFTNDLGVAYELQNKKIGYKK
jgi:uncharacterized protein (DUF488 family)